MTDIYAPYVVTKKISEAPGVVTLWVAPKEGARPDFIPGQFVNIHLPALGSEAKSYTIASAPHDTGYGITIREVGTFSRTLMAHEPGQELLLSQPLGYFYPEDETPRIFLAAGIGITPYISMVRARSSVPTVLLYSNRTPTDAVFAQELSVYSTQLPLSVTHFTTRANGEALGAIPERINASHIKEALTVHTDAHVYLCGGIGFVRDMRLHLKALGVPEERQFTESFF